MKKFILITLLIFTACGKKSEAIQGKESSLAVQEATIKETATKICESVSKHMLMLNGQSEMVVTNRLAVIVSVVNKPELTAQCLDEVLSVECVPDKCLIVEKSK